MKVLVVSSNYPPNVGGPAVTANYLTKKLIKKGVSAKVLTNGVEEDYKDPDYVIRTPVIKQNKKTLKGALLRIYYLFKELNKISKDYDLIISQDTNISGLAVYLNNLIKHTPYLVKFSGDLAVEYLYNKTSLKNIQNDKNLTARVLHWIQKIVCNNSIHAIATSEYNKKCMKRIGIKKSKIKKIPNGIIKQKIDKKIIKKVRKKYGRNLICTACRLVKWKNLNFLIKVMKKLPSHKLIIYGEGPERTNLKKLIKELKLKNVILYGKVPYNKIQSYIKACDYFTLASEYEPFGIAILDALIVKTPVIVSNIGGMPEVAEKNGVVFEPNNEKSFLKKFKKLKKIKVKIPEKYKWNNIIKDYIKILKETSKRFY